MNGMRDRLTSNTFIPSITKYARRGPQGPPRSFATGRPGARPRSRLRCRRAAARSQRRCTRFAGRHNLPSAPPAACPRIAREPLVRARWQATPDLSHHHARPRGLNTPSRGLETVLSLGVTRRGASLMSSRFDAFLEQVRRAVAVRGQQAEGLTDEVRDHLMSATDDLRQHGLDL